MKIVAVDFDNTLCFSNWPDLGEPNLRLIEYLKLWRNHGNKLFLWSCRSGNDLQQAVNWCTAYGLQFDAINENLPEIIDLYGADSRKISADFYIDDRCILLQDTFSKLG